MKPDEDITRVAGPGAYEDAGISPKPILEGASEYEYVEILNPMSVDFIGQFGLTKPIRAEVTISPTIDGQKLSETEAQQTYGIPRLTNPAKSGNANIINRTRIPSGKTIRVLGNEAQVLVRQLVNEIMQREGKKLQLADAFARHQVEERIVISRGNLRELPYFAGDQPKTVQEQLQAAINQPLETEGPIDEPEIEFPVIPEPAQPGPAATEPATGSSGEGATPPVLVGGDSKPQRRKRRTKAQMAAAKRRASSSVQATT